MKRFAKKGSRICITRNIHTHYKESKLSVTLKRGGIYSVVKRLSDGTLIVKSHMGSSTLISIPKNMSKRYSLK